MSLACALVAAPPVRTAGSPLLLQPLRRQRQKDTPTAGFCTSANCAYRREALPWNRQNCLYTSQQRGSRPYQLKRVEHTHSVQYRDMTQRRSLVPTPEQPTCCTRVCAGRGAQATRRPPAASRRHSDQQVM